MGNEKLFRDESIGKLILKTSLPSVLIILMMLIYNMADIFFIGQTGDALQVAAVSLSGPLLSILSGLGTLVGAGGCAAIATAWGKGETQKVRSMSSFCGWGAIAMGLVFALVFFAAQQPILKGIGTSGETLAFTQSYLRIIGAGAPLMIFSSAMANVVRGQGAVKESMTGNILGNVVNILLDPLFISVFGWGVAGAAFATVIGNGLSSLYFLRFLTGKKSVLSMDLKDFSLKPAVSLKVLSLGLPTAFSVLLMSLSSILVNNIAAAYGDRVIAAMGVAGRVGMLVSMVQMGICMGVQPAVSYNFGARLFGRMNALLKRTLCITLGMGSLLTALVYFGRTPMVAFFLDDQEVIRLGESIVAISMVTGPIFGIGQLCTIYLQSTDKASMATVASVLRQGLFLLPAVLILNRAFGLTGLLWSSVVADLLSTAANLLFALRQRGALKKAALSEETVPLGSGEPVAGDPEEPVYETATDGP